MCACTRVKNGQDKQEATQRSMLNVRNTDKCADFPAMFSAGTWEETGPLLFLTSAQLGSLRRKAMCSSKKTKSLYSGM